jgi:hypothetical protein
MKNKIVTISFLIVFLLIFVLNIITPAEKISISERRELATFPELSIETVLNGEFFKKFEKYELDQMIFRDKFRSVKARVEFSLFNKYDNNDIFIKNDTVFKMDYPYNENYVYDMSEKMNKLYDTYLRGMKVYYSIIPDKNYFIKDKDKHLFIDYAGMLSILNSNVKNMKYIDLYHCLSLEDYYKTDIHWKQENLGKVVKALGEKMHFTGQFKDTLFEKRVFSPFYGAYYGQAALPIKPDTLTYLTNQVIEEAKVDNYEYSGVDRNAQKVYDMDKLKGIDAYDVFLSGATPLTEIENPENTSGRELIIFRDSFGSSLTPLLLSEYSKITLIDLRYVNSDMIGEFVKFKNQDVLFLYNTSIVNHSNILK